MPPIYKVLVSAFVVLAALGAHVFRDAIALRAPDGLLALLVLVMLGGLWLFPEPKKAPAKKP